MGGECKGQKMLQIINQYIWTGVIGEYAVFLASKIYNCILEKDIKAMFSKHSSLDLQGWKNSLQSRLSHSSVTTVSVPSYSV